MKKIGSIALALLFALTMAGGAFAASDYGFLTEVTSTSFLPSTIHGGDSISLAIDIKNRGSALTAEDLVARLEVGTQFTAIDTNYIVGDILPQATKTAILKFRANDDIVPGYYPVFLTIEYMRDGDLVSDEQTLSVPVSMAEKNIDVTVEPKIINPGNQTELVFRLTNIAGTPISNISFSWDESNDLVLPLGSDNKRYVNNISSEGSTDLIYVVAADPNISPGIYPIDISISFTDVEGTKTQESQVGLIIGGETDFEVSAEVKSSQLSISIANIGSNNADSVVVKIPEQNSVRISGTSVEILGNLNKGDFTIANFTMGGSATAFSASSDTSEMPARSAINIPGLGMGGGRQTTALDDEESDEETETMSMMSMINGEISVQIDYTDTTGERHEVIKTVELNTDASSTSSDSTASTARTQRSGLPLAPIGLLVVFLGGAAAYNKYKANKDWKELAKRLGAIALLFLAAIFLLNSDTIALAIASLISAGLLWRFFRGK